ncbi:hypothetical protein BGX31_005429 [Mortierella sp. GBA43]|nr:hypothetical protein BGX31_005429 [Mortierella sp. GBA43]
MSLQVNLAAHGHDLKAAYEAILRPVDPKKGDNWALFGYDKGTNDLKVLGQGNGGLEELQDEFVDGKIQYAFTRIVDPYSQLNKFVFIAWCGDGVPESKKGLFNTHLADVANFLKGYHLQINARCEADVTPAQIMKRAQEGSGSKYSTHQEDYTPERISQLQPAYQKTVVPDIAALRKNPTKPEPAPKAAPEPPVNKAHQLRLEREAREKEERDRIKRENANSEVRGGPSQRSTVTTAQKVAEERRLQEEQERERIKRENANSEVRGGPAGGLQNSAQRIAEERRLQEERERERIKRENANSEVRGGPAGGLQSSAQRIAEERRLQEERERERIKRENANSEIRGGPAGGLLNNAQKVAEERRLQEEREREREQQKSGPQEVTPRVPGVNRFREERLQREKEERARAEAEDAARSARDVTRSREDNSAREQAAAREEEEQRRQRELKQRQEREAEEQRAREGDARRRQQEEDEEERLYQQRQKEEEEHRSRQQQQEEEEHQRRYEEEQEERRLQEEAQDRERQLAEQVNSAAAKSAALGAGALLSSADHPELASSGSVSAIVLYQYDKSEENEMSLIEGEIIRNITELDVGWWSGESEDGTRSGLFPANYVEIIEDTGAAPAQHHQEQENEPTSLHHAHEQPHGAHDEAQGPSALALYDYQAAEPNEISFEEGETITEIEFVSDDWWNGKNRNGGIGLFPANYVQLNA